LAETARYRAARTPGTVSPPPPPSRSWPAPSGSTVRLSSQRAP